MKKATPPCSSAAPFSEWVRCYPPPIPAAHGTGPWDQSTWNSPRAFLSAAVYREAQGGQGVGALVALYEYVLRLR